MLYCLVKSQSSPFVDESQSIIGRRPACAHAAHMLCEAALCCCLHCSAAAHTGNTTDTRRSVHQDCIGTLSRLLAPVKNSHLVTHVGSQLRCMRFLMCMFEFHLRLHVTARVGVACCMQFITFAVWKQRKPATSGDSKRACHCFAILVACQAAVVAACSWPYPARLSPLPPFEDLGQSRSVALR